MRASLAVPFLISLSLASYGQASQARSIKYGRSDADLVEARDVEAALDILRRANYNFEKHVVKRSDSYSFKTGSDICYCQPDHKHTSTLKPHHHHSTSTKKEHHTTTPYHHHDPHSYKPEPKTTTSSSAVPTWTGHHGHHHGPHSYKPTPSSSSSSSPPRYTGKGSCPSGYKYAGKGDTYIYNDNDLIDASDLDLTINILNYPSATSSSASEASCPAKGSPKCEHDHCCYKVSGHGPSTGSGSGSGSGSGGSKGSGSGSGSGGSGGKASCPSGYTSYSKGDTIIKNDNDLIDLSDLTITLNILSYTSASSTPVSTSSPASDKPTCKDETCCVKQTSKKGNTIIENNNDLIDASGAKVKVCILSLCSS